MKIELTIKKEFNVKYLSAKCEVRYWEDATVDGVPDVDGKLIPCKNSGLWNPIIDVETGIITNWTKGVTAEIHYKVCDSGTYILKDENMNDIKSVQDYVIDMMSPGGSGHGDYVIMTVDENGVIKNWSASFIEFYDSDSGIE